ncbi:MAG: hypothetical protein KDA61_21375 [Planctomycetales bacterium]|nr:hypothetical protein [Planctomycetales bacterium]
MDDWGAWLTLAHMGATWAMVGLIWFVQIVHYRLFEAVPDDAFCEYEQAHCRLTAWVVGPPMLVEAGTAVAMAFAPPAGTSHELLWIGLALVAFIWAVTYGVQVPAHRRLSESADLAARRQLVRGNWWRTAAWSARGLVAGALVAQQM